MLCMAMLVAIRVSMESMSARLPEPEVEAEREVDQPMALLEAAADALERGDLETSAAMLERATTTQGDALEGAEELRFRLERERWRATLPLRFVARHEHRVGHCTGDLVLRAESIRFESSRHRDWLWEATDVERLDRVDDDELELLGSEPDGNAGDIERYRFTMLRPSMGIDAFREYRKFFGH